MNQKFSSTIIFTLAIVLAITVFSSQANGAVIQNSQFQYQIDRTAVPSLNEYDLTVIINVSNAQTINVRDGANSPIPYTNGPAADEITVTTDKSEINVELFDLTGSDSLGNIRKADLKDNRVWAYSHGFDDNYFLEQETAVFLERGIPAGFNVVSDWITEPASPFDGDFQYWEFRRLVDAGWAINNHTVAHESGCGANYDRADRKADVLQAQNQLRNLLAGTSRPDYKVIGFTIPCGYEAQFRDYPGIINEIRNNGEDTLLYTDGVFEFPLHMDVTAPFDIETVIRRDSRIDGSGANTAFITGQMNQVSALAKSGNKPLWYTTFSHGEHLFGDNTTVLAESLDYLIVTYGTQGSNEVWIAPTSVVVSYLLVRDLSVILKDGAPLPTPTPSPTPTAIPSACNEIDNGAFDSGTANWQSFGTLEIVNGRSGNGLRVSNGHTSQSISNAQTSDYLFQGYVSFDSPSTSSWNGVGVDYLNSAGVEIGEKSLQLYPNGSGFAKFEIRDTPPAGTASVNVWLFSGSSGARLTFDDIDFVWSNCDPTVPTATPPPSETELPPVPSSTPTATELPGQPGTPQVATPTADPTNPASTPPANPTPAGTAQPPIDLSEFIYLPLLAK